jgi:hypothetical protein
MMAVICNEIVIAEYKPREFEPKNDVTPQAPCCKQEKHRRVYTNQALTHFCFCFCFFFFFFRPERKRGFR